MKSFSEMLKGNQHKIDKNKNGKVDAHDFKLLRKMKKEEVAVEEETCGCPKCVGEMEEQAPVAPVPDRKYIKGTPEYKKYMATKKPRTGMPTNEEAELDEVAQATGDLKDACWKGYTAVGMKMKNGKKVPNCVPVKEEEELDEKMDVSKADMGTVIKDFQKSDAPQFAGKSKEKRRQMAIAAKLQADRMKKEGVEMKSYKQFMEDLLGKLPGETEVNEEVEQIDELDMNLLKSMQKHAKANPRPKSSSDDAIDPKTGRLKPYGYRGKSEYEKSETGDDDEPKKRGRKTGVSVGSYKRRQPK